MSSPATWLFSALAIALASALEEFQLPRAQRGRSCEQGASERGDFSLIGSPFYSGKKTCHRKSAILCSLREAFVRKDAAFMSISRAKVTQLARGTLDWLKTWSVTVSYMSI